MSISFLVLVSLSLIVEFLVLTFCRRELTSVIHTTAEIFDNTVIAVYTRHGLAVRYKTGIEILKLSRSRYLHHSLKQNLTFIPTYTFFTETNNRRGRQFSFLYR